jgi:hypothetical protein
MIGAADVRLASPDEPCPCRSLRLARECCLDERGHMRALPASVPAPPLSAAGSPVTGCYAAPLGGCSPPLTGEHYFSHAVLRRLASSGTGEGRIDVSKMPWLPAGETRTVSASQLKVKVLCKAHNSALSPYDALGDAFCALLLKTGEPGPPDCRVTGLFNGEDLERWFLKTLCAVTAMEAKHARVRWSAPKPWLEALFGIKAAMPSQVGLWLNRGGFVMFPGGSPSMSATPIDDPESENPQGLRLHFCGLEWVLLTTWKSRSRWLPNGILRPGMLTLDTAGYCSARIGISYRYSPLGVSLTASGKRRL